MITNRGNQIITKYMLGQAPEYAAYISVGVGAQPLLNSENDTSLPTKKMMDFEAFRVPVLSRGIVNDTITIDIDSWQASSNLITVTTSTNHGIKVGDEIDISFSASADISKEGTFTVSQTTSNTFQYDQTIANGSWLTSSSATATATYVRDRLIFKAQLPPDQQYQMTEMALYPAANNQLALGYDSRFLSGFLTTEGWVRYDGVDNDISLVTTNIGDGSGNISASVVGDAVFVNSNNQIFDNANRMSRLEQPRFLNRHLLISGNTSSFTDDNMLVTSSTAHVSTSDASLDLSKNSPNDYIKLALSVISSQSASPTIPNKVRVRLDFVDSVSGGIATAKTVITSAQMTSSRYQIIEKEITDFDLSESFSWARIGQIRIYAQTINSGGSYDGSYIALDGIRLDNVNTENPLYSMVAYSVLKNNNDDGMPIQKTENSQAYIEYRMGVSIY